MLYKMPAIVSINAIYNVILRDINNMYRGRNKDEQIIISLVDTIRIDSNALLIFVGLLNKLSNKCNKPIFLELLYKPKLLGFLDSVRFFEILSKLRIIEYDKELIGGFSSYHFNEIHKIHFHSPIMEYEKKSEIEKLLIRDEQGKILRMHVQSKYINSIRKFRLSDQEKYIIEMAISEIILNAQIYSGSYCFEYLQTGIKFQNNKKGILFSVVDVGKGFKNSLIEKLEIGQYCFADKSKFERAVDEIGIDRKQFGDYLTIMEALYFSQIQPREVNLYNLKNELIYNHANFRIHFNTTQISFAYKTCYKCTSRDILNCLSCAYKNTITQQNLSKRPIKIYPTALSGVHIEMEFILEES